MRRQFESYFPKDFNGTVLIYKKGRLFKKAIGYRDGKNKSRMQIDDVFQLASVSKTMTAVAVMQLYEKDKIELDSFVYLYLEDFPYRAVTVRHLLNHRSGLPNYMYFSDTIWKDSSNAMQNQDLYQYIVKNKPALYLPAGFSFSYCNTNYAILATLVEKVSGMPFHSYLEQHIFKPAGMRNTFLYGHQPKRISAEVMIGRYDKQVYNQMYYQDGILGDKSVYSTVEDLFLFHIALFESRILKKESLSKMKAASYKHNVYGGTYGLGFRLVKTKQAQWTYHNGWWRGFWTSFWNHFEKEICVVILTNNKRSSHINKVAIAEELLLSEDN